MRVAGSSPHKGKAEILKAEKVKSGGTGGGCSGGIGEAGRLSQRQVISAALSGGRPQFTGVGNVAGMHCVFALNSPVASGKLHARPEAII
jgi:hypothetical protein